MRAIAKLTSISLFILLGAGIEANAQPRAFQETPSAQDSATTQSAPAPQTRGEGGQRRMGLFGKLTAVHDQSIELATPKGDTVTVKISESTQFRKEGQNAKLSNFKVGDTVIVRGEENADHTWTAEMIGSRTGGVFSVGAGGGPEGGMRGGPGMMQMMGVLGQDYIFGEVKAIDAPKLTILRPDNVTQTVELSEETSLRKGRDSITMADIQAGDHVMVRGGMKDNAFQPKSVMVIGAEQWKRMQEMRVTGGPVSNPPKDNNQQQKPPEPPH